MLKLALRVVVLTIVIQGASLVFLEEALLIALIMTTIAVTSVHLLTRTRDGSAPLPFGDAHREMPASLDDGWDAMMETADSVELPPFARSAGSATARPLERV